MSEKYIYSVNYRYVCESCGRATEWTEHCEYGVTAPGELPEPEKLLEDENIRERRGSLRQMLEKGSYSFLSAGDACPACGARQSWKPPHDFVALPLHTRIALSAVAAFVLGMLCGFVVCALFGFTDAGIVALLVVTGGATLLGVAGAAAVNLLRKRENERFLAAVPHRCVPEIDWSSERVRLVVSHTDPDPAAL